MDTLTQPGYFPDLVSSDYFLFRSLQYYLQELTVISSEEAKNNLDIYFANKEQKYYEHGIMLLHDLRQKYSIRIGKSIIYLNINSLIKNPCFTFISIKKRN